MWILFYIMEFSLPDYYKDLIRLSPWNIYQSTLHVVSSWYMPLVIKIYYYNNYFS